jgi:hypothetical protein
MAAVHRYFTLHFGTQASEVLVPQQPLLAIFVHDHIDLNPIDAVLVCHGYDVLDLTNADTASLALKENPVDVIVVDIQGPLNTAALVRMKKVKPDVPIIRIISPLAVPSLDIAGTDRVLLHQDVPTHLPEVLHGFAGMRSQLFRRWWNEWCRRLSA